MDCEQALEAISAALDGELDEASEGALRAHLELCPECRALADDFGVLSGALSRLEQAPPPGLAQDILNAVGAEPARSGVVLLSAKRKKRWWAAALSAAAVAALAIGLGAPMFRMGSSSADNQAAPAAMAEESGEAVGQATSGGGYSFTAPYAIPPGDAEAPQTREAETEADAPAADAFDPESFAAVTASGPQESGAEKISGGTFNAPTEAAADAAPPGSEPERNECLTQADALELVFGALGGYDAYPDGTPDEAGYLLRPAEETLSAEGGQRELRLDFDGLSENGQYYRFWLYWLYTESQDAPDSAGGHTATVNFYAVSLEDGGILAERPETGWDAEQAEAFRRTINE